MKKFLTVLLVIAVMFTFSFSTSFAAMGDTYNYTQAANLVSKTVDDLLLASQNAMNHALSAYVEGHTDNQKTIGMTTVNISKDAAKKLFQDKYDVYYNALTAVAKTQQQALADAWNLDNNATFVDGVGNTLDTTALKAVTPATYTVASATERAAIEAEFDATQAAQKADLEAISTTKYADTKPVGETKTYAQIAQDEIVKALNQVLGYKVYSTTTDAAIVNYINYMKAVYTAPVGTGDASGALAVGGTVDTTTYRAGGLNALKTATVVVTDDAKIEYAKKRVLAVAEQVIASEKARLIKIEENTIFKQEVSSSPNQSAINTAKKNIDTITKQYDALLKVWTYRLNNAEYKVEKAAAPDTNEYVYAYYDDVRYNKVQKASLAVAYYDNNELKDYGVYANQVIGEFTTILPLTNAVALVEHADELTEQAELLKASVAVDGNTAVAIDEALADAIEDTYMNGNLNAALDTTTVNYEAHKRIHALLGDTCAQNGVLDANKKEVKIEGKTYDTVLTWADPNAYDKTKLKEVKAIVKETKAALKATKTVAEADAAFLAAYEKFDAVMTDAEHTALFTYGGELYTSYPKAVAEIKAYIDYKASLMADTYPGTSVATLKTYFEKQLKDDSYNSEDLAANLAAAKATVDTLKTKAEMTTEEAALYKEVLKVADPVKLADKDAVVDLYKRVMAFNDYEEMVGFVAKTASVQRINKAVLQLAGLERDEIDTIVDAIEKDYKVTLEDKENVVKFLAAIDAYNDLYVDKLEVVTNFGTNSYTYLAKLTDSKDFEGKIFALEVKEASKLIAALPSEGATVAQLKAARDAVDALGFEGICKINPTLMTKLNRLDQNSNNGVEALKITASSTAKKGSITVKWTVEGDAAAADGFQVWKSTKHSSGYKKAFTTTKTSYKNTKGLKKGTRYYYKVRAFKVVDGKNVYSDWSNKARRVAK